MRDHTTVAADAPVNLADFARLARSALPTPVWDYVDGGAGDESTVRANRSAFERVAIRPRVLVDVRDRTTTTTMLGAEVAAPIAVAPMAYHRLADPEGEVATVRAAGAAGLVTVLGTFASRTIEESVAAAGGPVWLQLYCFRDRGVTGELVRRAEDCGCAALVLTADAPLLGRRNRDLRNDFHLPPGVGPANFAAPATGRRDVAPPGGRSEITDLADLLMDDGLTWEVVEWLRERTDLPIVVKGVLTAEDAEQAVSRGAAAVLVSNHGGRQVDGAIATLDALPEIADRAGSSVEVYLDGGVRCGADVVKALALGARAVFLGRPVLWGLAAAGESGVREVLRVLTAEFESTMALSGCRTPAGIGPESVVRGERRTPEPMGHQSRPGERHGVRGG